MEIIKNNKKKIGIPLVVILIIGVWIGYGAMTTDTGYEEVSKIDFADTVIASGNIAGEGSISLSFQSPGVIKSKNVEEGDEVEEGEELFVLENEEKKLAVEQSEKQLEQMRSEIRSLETTDYSDAQSNLHQAEAEYNLAESRYDYVRENEGVDEGELLKQAEIEYETMKDQYEGKKELYDAGFITTTEYQDAKKAKEIAESSLELAEKDYEGAHLDIEQAESDLASAEYQLQSARNNLQEISGEALERARLEKQQAEASLEEAEIAYQNTFLTAPSDGQVNQIHENQGSYVNSGQEIFTFIPESDATYAEVRIDEDLVGQVSVGQEAILTTSAFSDRSFDAVISHIAPRIDPDRGTFTVTLELDEYVSELVTDLSVFAEIIVSEKTDAIVLNEGYVHEENGREYVYIEENGRAVERKVKTSELGENQKHIEEGLEPGERVLTNPELSHDQRISLVEE